jgi:hypothetical protein
MPPYFTALCRLILVSSHAPLVKTAAQIANDAKVRIQQDIVRMLRAGEKESRHETWRNIKLDIRLWKELATYDLSDPERRSHLNKVAFPNTNHDEVDAALKAGNNLNQIYNVACGHASIPRNAVGKFIEGKKGLKIVTLQKT